LLTSTIKKQIRERDRLKSLAILDINRTENYWNAYKTSRNRVTDALRETKAAYYKGEFKKVKHDPKQAWETVNKILNRKQEGREINCLETQRGQISHHATELAECLNNYFTNIGPDIAKISIMVTEISRIISRQQLYSSFNFQTVSEYVISKSS
jgi:tRNA A37 threonylcarbamoyladenosine modification protein TsaB